MTKIFFLGTNGWYPSETGHTTCSLIDAPEAYIILDAGTGILNIDRLISEDKPIFLFLSHLHFDHIYGLHILNKFKFKQGLNIVLHDKNYKPLMNIFRQPFTVAPKDLPFDVNFKILNDGRDESFPFGLVCLEQIHSSPCFGFRFEFINKVITYCTDTGKCPAIFELARDSDLLITECALLPNETNATWPHMNPTDSAECAKSANCKQLALLHFDAEKYASIKIREYALKETKKKFRNSFLAKDGAQLII